MTGPARWLCVAVALVAFAAGAAAAAVSHHGAPPSPVVLACQRLANADALSHPDAAVCVRCERDGGTYTYYMTGTVGWACDGGRER